MIANMATQHMEASWGSLCECVHILSLVRTIIIVRVHVHAHYSLRAPKAPDANADMGQHSFSYAVMPHSGK